MWNKRGKIVLPLGAGSEWAERGMLTKHRRKMERSIVRAYREGKKKELMEIWEFFFDFSIFGREK